MNKMKRFLVGIIALSAVILLSCNNLAGGKVVEKGVSPVLSEKTTLTISIEEMLTSAQKPAVSRNIMPSPWTDEEAGALYYKLTGSKTSGFTTGEITSDNTFTYAQINGGTAKIVLESTTWYLKLTAYTDSGYTKVALESAETTVNLTGGNNSVNFVMVAPETTTATGSVNVTVKFEKPDNFASVTYGIYDGSLPDSTSVGSTFTDSSAQITAVSGEAGYYSVNYSNSAFAAGKKYFNATFKDVNDKIICFYSDSIQIDGGNDTTKTITLTSAAFNKPAANPTSLSVAYSYNDTSAPYTEFNNAELTSTGTVSTNYYAIFTWIDNSNNETGFELVVTDNADTANPITYNSSSSLSGGSLSASSTTATIALTTGHVYTAKIRAVNDFTTTTTYTNLSGNVNLFTVAYDLSGGNVNKASDSVTDDTVITYVIPRTSSTSAQSLLGAVAATSPDPFVPYVSKTNYTFTKWYESGDTTKAAVTEIAANNTANMSLKAEWYSELGVTISLPTYDTDYALVSGYSEAAVYSISGIQSDATPVTVSLTPNTGLTDATWTVYNNSNYSTPITANIESSASNLTWTITDSANNVLVPAGTYRIAVSGTHNGAVTGNVYIQIIR